MGSTAVEFRTRIAQALMDTGGAIYDSDLVLEALRQALNEYSGVLPQELETTITLVADGREISLAALSGLVNVLQVWWPYDSAAPGWPPNQVKGFRVWWDNGNPVLFLHELAGAEPRQDDELRLWYSANQTIEGLDSATVTTVRPDHESLLVVGAAAYAAMARAEDLIETSGTDLYQVGLLGSWAVKQRGIFQAGLAALRGAEARQGPSWGAGWSVDKWDSRDTGENF
jgi:hypothetical protein